MLFVLNQYLSGLLFSWVDSYKESCSQFVSLKSPDELFLFNSLLEFFRVALLFICQGTSKAGLCAKGIFGSLLTINSFCAKDYGATAHNERVSRELSLRF